jgi:hypothetical protein
MAVVTNAIIPKTIPQGEEALTVSTTQPTTPNEGDIYYDTTAGTLKIYKNGAWQTAKICADATQ